VELHWGWICHRKYGPGNFGPAGPKLLRENRSGRTILTGKNGPGPGVLVRLVRRCYSSASQVQDTAIVDPSHHEIVICQVYSWFTTSRHHETLACLQLEVRHKAHMQLISCLRTSITSQGRLTLRLLFLSNCIEQISVQRSSQHAPFCPSNKDK